jgi:exopolysaccharide biosynthesis WecB/TagA/CpsF family protein
MMNWVTGADADGAMVQVTAPSRSDLLDEIRACLIAREGFSIATLNLDHVVKLGRDDEFRRAYASHSHVCADGNPIVWLSRISGTRVDLVPGSELIVPVAEIAAETDTPVALFGATEMTLKQAGEALKTKVPGLRIVASFSPPMGFDPEGAEAEAFLNRIAASGARLCFIALGAPKQEVFAAYASKKLGDTGFLSIGAGLDFLAGTQRRAPAVVRALKAEWIWRLLSNPRRLARRYWDCILILPSLTRAALRQRNAKG